MPEPLELRLRRGERRRVAVPEPDHRDPSGEVEVAATVRGGQPRTFAIDEGDAGTTVGWEDGRAHDDRHAVTRVAPISVWTPPRAAWTAARSFGTMPPSNVPSSRSRSA